jgi:hypothetical protein
MRSFPYVLRVFVVCRLTVRCEYFFSVSALRTASQLIESPPAVVSGMFVTTQPACSASNFSSTDIQRRGVAFISMRQFKLARLARLDIKDRGRVGMGIRDLWHDIGVVEELNDTWLNKPVLFPREKAEDVAWRSVYVRELLSKARGVFGDE